MSYNGHLVVDTDTHIREYWDLDRTYKEYIDPKYLATYERLSAAIRGAQRRPGDVGFGPVYTHPPLRPLGVYDAFGTRGRGGSADGEAPNRAILRNGTEIDPACNWDPNCRLRDMDEERVDVHVLFSSQSDNFCVLHDVGFERALNEAYHRYASAFCSESKGRLRWLTNAVIRDIPATIAELTYWAEHDENYAGVFVTRMLPDGGLLDSPDLYPLWERTQDLDLPIWVHGDPDHQPLTPGYASLNNAAFSRPVLKGWGGQAALGALIGGGVFDLFPRLRIGFFENGGGSWMPWFIEKLDEGYRPGSSSTPYMKRKPSEIVAGGQVFCAIDPLEKLRNCVEDLGEDVWLLGTDYPHTGTPWPNSVSIIADRPELSESAKIKMLGENAKRFLPRLCA